MKPISRIARWWHTSFPSSFHSFLTIGARFYEPFSRYLSGSLMPEHSQTPADRLKDVLSLDGAEFLGAAYLLMLGRPVDPEGFRNYSARLNSGASKLSIVAELHASPEGRAYGANVPDLLVPFAQGLPIATDIDELLALHDLAFIDCAYKSLLKRAPDAVGFSHYLKLIRSGAAKMRVVSNLAFSAEGRKAAPSLRGLRRSILNYWLARSRLTGWWYRPIAQVEGDTPLECRLRAVENALMRMTQDRERESSELDAAVDDVARLLKALANPRSV